MKKDEEMAISQGQLKCLLKYDPVSGVFTWRESKGTAKKGSIAGTVSGQGYVNIKLDGRLCSRGSGNMEQCQMAHWTTSMATVAIINSVICAWQRCQKISTTKE